MRPAIRSDSPILYLYYNKNFLICQGKETADGRLSEIIGLDGCGPPKITTIATTPKIAIHYSLLSQKSLLLLLLQKSLLLQK